MEITEFSFTKRKRYSRSFDLRWRWIRTTWAVVLQRDLLSFAFMLLLGYTTFQLLLGLRVILNPQPAIASIELRRFQLEVNNNDPQGDSAILREEERGSTPNLTDVENVSRILRRIVGKHVFYLSAIMDETGVLLDQNLFKQDSDDRFQLQVDAMDLGAGENEISTDIFQRLYRDSTLAQTQGFITLNGWEDGKHAKQFHTCCYAYDDGVKDVEMSHKNTWAVSKTRILPATQFICPLQYNTNDTVVVPAVVALTDGLDCNNGNLKYIPVQRLEKGDTTSIAVCAKIVFGNFTSGRLIEWLEFTRLMGAEKVMLFTYDLGANVSRVLDYYKKSGFLIVREFDFPMKLAHRRHVGGKNLMAWNDEQVTVFDCVSRFQSYGFVTVLDLDEFLIPPRADKQGTWKTMLEQLLTKYPLASGFSFHTQIFTLDWGMSNKNGRFFVTKYIKRTRSMWDRVKNIVIPSRVQQGSVWTHDYRSLPGYKHTKVNKKISNVFHYRECRSHWIRQHTCKHGRSKYTDKTMIHVMNRIRHTINNRMHELVNE